MRINTTNPFGDIMNERQQIRDGLIRIMRARNLTILQVSKEIPCVRITLDKFITSNAKLAPLMVLKIEQWVNDNLKEKNDTQTKDTQ